MRQADNKITGNRRFRRVGIVIIAFSVLLLLQLLALWSFYSYTVSPGGTGKMLLQRLWLWPQNIYKTPLVHISGAWSYMIKHWLVFIPMNIIALLPLMSRKPRGNYRDIEGGSACWAYGKELKLFSKRNNNQPLAKNVYMTKEADLPNGNVLLVANPGGGKSFRVLIPAIIQACRDGYTKPSMVITDTKGALYRDTCKMVENAGFKVRCLNLTDPRYSNLYNPLCNIHMERMYPELSSLALCYVNNSRDENAQVGQGFWEDTLYFLLMAVWSYQLTYEENPLTGMPETKALYRSVELIRGMKLEQGQVSESSEFKQIVNAIRETDPLHLAVTSFDSFVVAAAETAQSAIITFLTRMKIFSEPNIEMLTMDDEMNIDALCEPPTAFYLNFEVGSAYKVVAAMFLEQCFSSIYYIADTKHGGCLPVPCKMYLDEIANICKFHSLPERLSTARSYNIEITLCLQSLQQLKHLYEGKNETIINNCAVFAFLGGVEPDTLERVSGQLGRTTIDEVNANRTYSMQGSDSEADRRTGRELMTKDELLTMPQRKCVLIIIGHKPIHTDKCRTEKWKEYKLLGGKGNPKNSTDITVKYAAEYSLHLEAYTEDRERRIAKLKRANEVAKN